MSDLIYERIKANLSTLKMTNTLETIDNYLEHAIKEKLNIVEILDHIFLQEATFRNSKSTNMRINMAGFPFKKSLDDFDFDFQPSINKDQVMQLATMRFETVSNFV